MSSFKPCPALLLVATLHGPQLLAQPAEAPPEAADAGVADSGPPLPTRPLTLKEIEKQLEAEQRKKGLLPPEDPLPLQRLINGVPTDTLGDELPEIQTFPVEDVLADPSIFAGERIKIQGVVKRMCTTGCWVEVAEFKTASAAIRLIPTADWKFMPSDRDRRVFAYGKLVKRKLDAKAAKALDQEAGKKPKGGARTEWVLEAEGAHVQWLH